MPLILFEIHNYVWRISNKSCVFHWCLNWQRFSWKLNFIVSAATMFKISFFFQKHWKLFFSLFLFNRYTGKQTVNKPQCLSYLHHICKYWFMINIDWKQKQKQTNKKNKHSFHLHFCLSSVIHYQTFVFTSPCYTPIIKYELLRRERVTNWWYQECILEMQQHWFR